MSIKFIPPTDYRDYESACISAINIAIKSAKALAPTASPIDYLSFAPSIYKGFKDIFFALEKKESSSLENIAWKWLALTISKSVTQFVVKINSETELNFDNKEEAIKEFINSSMLISGDITFDIDALTNIEGSQVYDKARSEVPKLVAKITRLVVFDSDSYIKKFEDCLKKSAPYVISSQYNTFEGLLSAVSGPSAEIARREASWMRHYQWITNKFTKAPVFSPDGSVKTPLSELYLRPRCYWHEHIALKPKDGQPPERRWKAYVGDIHDQIKIWLSGPNEDRIRVIAGGPGSGKSSFALALASQISYNGSTRVIFVELQRFNFIDRLYSDIGNYLVERNGNAKDGGSAGFPESPLLWTKTESKPVLIIFDGLDELTHDDEHAKQKARDFILRAKQFVDDSRQDGADVRAIFLGRSLACQDGMKAASLPIQSMLHVAPIRELTLKDLRPSQLHYNEEMEFPELSLDFAADQRPLYWSKWTASQGDPKRSMPDAITHDNLSSLNVEPLLLHLLILSDFCGPRWVEAADNRNLVYEDIIQKIHSRNSDKRNANKGYSLSDFMLLMECLGITAWRGNGRAGEEHKFNEIRDIHARHRLKELREVTSTSMDSVVLQTHARRVEGDTPGFEFIHKSFGEYLAARGLMTLAERTASRMANTEDPLDENSAALRWVKIIKDSEITDEILLFLNDEARRRLTIPSVSSTKTELSNLLKWVQRNGMPAHVSSDLNFRHIENIQRCSEVALLAATTAVAAAMAQTIDTSRRDESIIKIFSGETEPGYLLERIRAINLVTPSLLLHDLDFNGTYIYLKNLVSSDLRRSNLSGSHLSQSRFGNSNLSETDMTNAVVRESDFTNSVMTKAILDHATLRKSKFNEAKMGHASLNNIRAFGANFNGAYAAHSSWIGAYLEASSFRDTNLEEANFSQAVLINSSLSGANFSNTILTDSKLKGSRVDFANFSSCIDLNFDELKATFGVSKGYGKTLVPDGFEPPDHWYVSYETDNDDDEDRFYIDFLKEYKVWFWGKGFNENEEYILDVAETLM